MNRESTTIRYKILIAFLGMATLIFCALRLETAALDWRFSLLFLFTVLIAPRMSVSLPRSKFIISFSDSMVFLTFLYFGGEAAVVMSAAETFANCLYYRLKGVEFARHTIIFNVGASALATGVTFVMWTVAQTVLEIDSASAVTTNLITILGVLSFSQFISSSLFASLYFSIKTGQSLWNSWRKDGFAVSVTHFAGAGLAGLTYKLLNYGDIYSIVISLVAVIVTYFNYRQIIGDMTESIEQAEHAEREKAEAERERRLEIEQYAEELAHSLRKEEQIGKELLRSKREYQHAALHDSLTQLPNRAFFIDIVKTLIEENKESGKSEDHVLFVDLSRFKSINDSLGHTTGDKVLMVVAKRFQKAIRSRDRVARLGGDEFAIILRGVNSVEKAEKVAWKLHQEISRPFTLSKSRIHLSVNIGIAPCKPDYNTPEEVLRDADIAMHHAKENGTGVEVFNTELRRRFMEQAILEAELPFAIECNELSMHYQPLISLTDGSIIGFEALLRWFHRENIFISPAQFIPIAENTGLIIPITRWILRETCHQLAEWHRLGPEFSQLVVSVNISGKHLSNFSLIDDVKKALKESQLPPSSLKLEITESAAMENAVETIQILTSLKQLGVQLSIDDFGTGYSSLSYLHRLPVDTLKIDRSFVNSVGENGEDSQILQTIISLAKNLRLRVIAEGIETENQLAVLRQLGCDYGQGYLMSKPLPKNLIAEQLRSRIFWLPESFAEIAGLPAPTDHWHESPV